MRTERNGSQRGVASSCALTHDAGPRCWPCLFSCANRSGVNGRHFLLMHKLNCLNTVFVRITFCCHVVRFSIVDPMDLGGWRTGCNITSTGFAALTAAGNKMVGEPRPGRTGWCSALEPAPSTRPGVVCMGCYQGNCCAAALHVSGSTSAVAYVQYMSSSGNAWRLDNTACIHYPL